MRVCIAVVHHNIIPLTDNNFMDEKRMRNSIIYNNLSYFQSKPNIVLLEKHIGEQFC